MDRSPQDKLCIPRRPPTGPPSPSFAQERIWFLDQLEPGSPAYNRPAAFRIKCRLDVEALEKSLREIIRRHETLRSCFPGREGQIVLEIAETLSVSLPVTDLTGHPGSRGMSEARRVSAEEARRPFRLSSTPLLRANLLKLGEEDHVLLVTFHHIVFDGWSERIFSRELAVLYRDFIEGKRSTLEDLPIQYPDFAHWQKSTIRGGTLQRLLSYWKSRLGESLPMLQLPTDRARPAVKTSRGARRSLLLSPELTQSLKALSRRHGVTLFVTLLSAFKVLLLRYSGEEDLVVGTPVAGRHHVETEGLIGLFINTLPLRSDLSGNPTFRELMGRVRKVVLDALENQHLPFEKLVEEINPERDLSRSPLFQAMFNMRNLPPRSSGIMKIEEFGFDTGIAQFDLTLEVMELPEGLRCIAKYSEDLFDAPTISRMLSHFEMLLEGIAANPEERLWRLPLLTKGERRQSVVEWNETHQPYPGRCVHELFEEQVDRTPDAVAAEYRTQLLTFGELNRRANKLARYLRARGVGQETTVGILVERCFDLLVGILAILKAGGACVSLDPSYPELRRIGMLEDSKTGILLTQERLLAGLSRYGGEIICLDAERRLYEDKGDKNLAPVTDPDHLAYVFFTSGSTGIPKGVQLHHRGVVNCLTFLPKAYGLSSADVVLQLCSCSFDPSIRDTVGALIAGARVVLIHDREAKDPAILLSRIREHRVTCLLSVVPTMLSAMLDEAREQGCSGFPLRLLLVSGENLLLSECRRARRVLGDGCSIVNQYGPTESTMTTTYYRVPSSESGEGVALIGRPIPNTRIYLLDRYHNPVPIGVPGELCIGGTGLSRGYVNRPDLTARSFVPNPLCREPDATLYKSGDLARYKPDGNIEILGRFDNQVKIRGNRVELEEVEAHLRQHPSVRTAAAALREDDPGNPRLVAYIVQNGPDQVGIGELQTFMRERVPEYMVPSHFVELDSLPLLPNRKIDRRALPPPQKLGHAEPKLPRDAVENQLARIWETTLGVSPVGVRDNFFELGGHSILATRLCSQIERAFQKRIPLADLFLAPTVEQMAILLSGEDKAASESTLVTIQTGQSKPPIFWVHSLGGHIIMYRNLAPHLGADQPVYAFEPQLIDGLAPAHSRIEEMAAHYLQDLIRHHPEPYLLGGQSFGGLVAFEMARQLNEPGAEVALLAILDTYAPGHRRTLPSMTRTAFRMSRWIDFQLQSLRQLRGRQKLLYLHDRLALRLVEMGVYRNREREKLIRLSKAHARASRAYSPQPYPGTVTLFRAKDQPRVGYRDPRLGWGKLAAEVEVQVVPGSHTSLIAEPHVRELGAKLRTCIHRALRA